MKSVAKQLAPTEACRARITGGLTEGQVSQPTPSRLPSNPCGSGGTTLKSRYGTSLQSRSGGGGGMQTVGYDGSQPLPGADPGAGVPEGRALLV